MYRKITKELMAWKDNFKKPLMVVGARQTGKTYIINKFCQQNFSNFLYINLEKEESIQRIFKETLSPEEIIEQIKIIKNTRFDINDTVIFFDEIQVSEEAITALKYFCESDLPYKIVCAGSLLGVKINRFKSSFPVGKVTITYMFPMDFEEFLIALDELELIKMIKKHYETMEALPEVIHEKAVDLYKKYLIIGGMPEVVKNFIDANKNLSDTNLNLQEQIITSYLADMNKYTTNTESIKNSKIYNAIPKELARENNTFKYSIVDEDARSSRYESSLEWLLAANMILRCNLVNRNESPLKAFDDKTKFKIYLSDVGLLRSLANIDYQEILFDTNSMFRGVLTENYVACNFYQQFRELYYYTFSQFEIDFLIKINGNIIPVEVKANTRTKSRSLNEYMNKYNPKYAIRLSLKNFGFENNIKSIPLYAIFCIKKES